MHLPHQARPRARTTPPKTASPIELTIERRPPFPPTLLLPPPPSGAPQRNRVTHQYAWYRTRWVQPNAAQKRRGQPHAAADEAPVASIMLTISTLSLRKPPDPVWRSQARHVGAPGVCIADDLPPVAGARVQDASSSSGRRLRKLVCPARQARPCLVLNAGGRPAARYR